jgi:hypothetical protein
MSKLGATSKVIAAEAKSGLPKTNRAPPPAEFLIA